MVENRETILDAWLEFVEGDDRQLWAMVKLLRMAEEDPAEALAIIVELMKRATSENAIGQLTAGPLERLVSANGRAVIDSLEATAERQPRLRRMLAGIYRIDVPDDVWRRIVSISGRRRQMEE